MSPGLLKRFRESIFEIFSNAILHSKAELGILVADNFSLIEIVLILQSQIWGLEYIKT